ncbi:MAG: hypothetical protein FWD52_04275 [Candidatus Bathyarchaeota archaeon]|nr:hypothetical protein [Candidatus Termiticorpusculum sp.]
MSFSSRSGSRRNAGVKVQRSDSQKKAALRKAKGGAKYLNAQSAELTFQDVVEKTLANIERLGNQTFALAPFSQYYDDWLINLRQIVLEFETLPDVTPDTVFIEEREQAFLDIQSALTTHRMQESAVTEAEKALYALNQELRTIETAYTEDSRTLNNKKNADTQQLTNQVKTLEEDRANQEDLKFGVFQFGAKKAATKKLEQTQQNLASTKKLLEKISQNFTTEHTQLHEKYVAKKQELATKSETLHKTIEQIEIDTSIETRKKTCTQLNNAIKELIKRLPTTTTTADTNSNN